MRLWLGDFQTSLSVIGNVKEMKERKLTDYEKSKAEKEFCFYHCKGFRDTKRCFCDSKCKDAQEFIQFLDYIVVKTKEDETEKIESV